jgi:hypothetical protein
MTALGAGMVQRLLPRQFDNRFDGQRAALWLLGALIALRLIMGVNSILNTESVAVGADGFQVDSYGADGARAVLMLFALTALGELTIAAVALTALVRYRSMVPFIYLLLLADQLARRAIIGAWSVARDESASAAFYIGWTLLLLPLLGLFLSLWPRARGDMREA